LFQLRERYLCSEGGIPMRHNQKGFTIVELLVAIAIASIVTVTVGGFMVVGARSFSSTSSEVNLQSESQLAFNQLQDLIIDTALGVTYSYVPASGSGEIKVLSDSEIPIDAVQKKLYMYNSDIIYVVIWERASSRLFYEEYQTITDVSGNLTQGTISGNAMNRMADYITSFEVDLSRLESKSIVRVDMGFEKAGKTYVSSHNITIRNKVIVNGDLATFTPILATPDGISGNFEIWVEPGRNYDLMTECHPVVAGTGGGVVSQEVRWYMDSSNPASSTATGIDLRTGELRVSAAELGDSDGNFHVRVVTRDGTKYAPITIHVVRVTAINFVFEPNTGSGETKDEDSDGLFFDDLAAEETFRLRVSVTGTHIDEAYANGDTSIYDTDISIVTGSGYVEQISYAGSGTAGVYIGTFKMKTASDMEGDKTIVIRATSRRSIDASYPYENNAGNLDPVYGDWSGVSYKKAFDFDIKGDRLYRGGQPVIAISDGWSALGYNRTDYFFIYYLTVTEILYAKDGTVTQTVKEGAANVGLLYNTWGETNLKLTIPKTYNPNAEYIFDMKCYVMAPKQSWHKGNSTMYGTTISNEYNLADAVAVGGNFTEKLHRVKVYYNGSERATYIPRKFGVGGSDEIFQQMSVLYKEGENICNVYNNGTTVAFYQDNSWNKYTLPITSGMMVTSITSDLNLRYYTKKWYDSIPQHLRIIPTVSVDGTQFLMFDSYVDMYSWNIDVGTNALSGALKGLASTKCYFPCPAEFTANSIAKNGVKTVWNYPFAPVPASYATTLNNTKLYYRLDSQNNADSTVRWNLSLYVASATNPYATYYCDSNNRIWTKIP